MNILLHPPRQPVPPNAFQFLLNASLVFSFLLLTWIHGLAFIRSESPLTGIESALLLVPQHSVFSQRGDPHPLTVFLEQINHANGYPPLLLNRLLSTAALLSCLWMMQSILCGKVHWLMASAGSLLLLVYPGFALQGISAGGGMLPLFFFLLAFSGLARDDPPGNRTLAGFSAAIAICLQPVWLLPVLGLLLGLWESDRIRPTAFLTGLSVTLFLSLTAVAALDSHWLIQNLLPRFTRATAFPPGSSPEWTSLAPLFLIFCLLLWLGRNRRGVGWWTLVLSLPAALPGVELSLDPAQVWLPLTALVMLGIPRLPMLLGLPFPATYQSVLGLQLLLWLPAYLGSTTWAPYPGPEHLVDAQAWGAIKSRIREAPGPVLTNADIAGRLQTEMWIYRLCDLEQAPANLKTLEKALTEQKLAYVLLEEDAWPVPDALKPLLESGYQPVLTIPPFVLWTPSVP